MSYLPLPVLAYSAYCFGYNVFIAHKVFKSLLWLGPLLVSGGLRQNMVNNAQSIIDSLYLLEGGDRVEIKTAYGERKGYAIRYLRRPTQQELNQFKMAGGPTAAAVMQEYFPVLVDSRKTAKTPHG